MFVSYKKYKRLKDSYDYLSEDRKKQLTEMGELVENMCDNYGKAMREADKYKKLYADELQKRLELAKLIKGETTE
jgi:hypothetical protein